MQIGVECWVLENLRIDLSASLGFFTHIARRQSGTVVGVPNTVGMSDCESSCYPVFFITFEDEVGVWCGCVFRL